MGQIGEIFYQLKEEGRDMLDLMGCLGYEVFSARGMAYVRAGTIPAPAELRSVVHQVPIVKLPGRVD